MSTYSLEDFYLQQVHDNLKRNKFTSSSWERIQEKSSTWKCYIYYETKFIGKLMFTFRFDFNNSRLIPLIVDIDLDTNSKKNNIDGCWSEIKINDNYKYSCTYDLNDNDSLKTICDSLIKLIFIKKPFWIFL